MSNQNRESTDAAWAKFRAKSGWDDTPANREAWEHDRVYHQQLTALVRAGLTEEEAEIHLEDYVYQRTND